ncbi:MAG: hypothetical protein ACFBSF_15050 [Leptolyngbyaceae cyanobacterium]
MASPRRRRRRPPRQTSQYWQQLRSWFDEPAGVPVGWLCLTGLLYAAIGMTMAAFPAPYWIWNLALGGAIAQAIALAGPQALKRFRWLSANGLAGLAILGTAAIGIALSIALGYSGTDNIDEIVPQETVFSVIRVSLIAIVIAALGAIVGANTGDRLLKSFNRLQTTLVLASACILGLGMGGLIGLLIAAE